MAYHSCVNYIEPNVSSVGFSKGKEEGFFEWQYKDDYNRTPRLEDYSIYFNLEVEVCSRENTSANSTITNNVLILSYKTNLNTSASTVNFMGGTKIKCNNASNSEIPYLTTNYADMYVGDLIDYGTTEMIGVKSIDVDFQNACIPTITVQFTDVRGISLFQPTELSRTNGYNGTGGINSDNVAQSFFQCFFRVPMPRFTMMIKGFYGKPVTYEVMCDKFDTKFNSKTGDFDITARFIGYGYSFLTDVSIDALLAAPYSDYGGKNGNYNTYWDREKNSGRFTIWNKEKTHRMQMPTLFEIWQEMKSLLSEPIEVETELTEEENSHEEEIDKLSNIRSLYRLWYEKLFNVCSNRYGKDYVFLFRHPRKRDEYIRLVVLRKHSTSVSMGGDFEQFPDDFKEIHKNLYTAIEEYNKSEKKFKNLKNVSLDFSNYLPQCLFNKTYVGTKRQVVFNGFDRENKIPENQAVNNIFYGVDYTNSGKSNDSSDVIKYKEVTHKRHVLTTIYGDGNDQYIKCYNINEDYTDIVDRIKALQSDANRNEKEKLREKKIKAINKEMFNRMSWYPTIENFTRIMMAHLETMMHLMYTVVTECGERTAGELGVTTGPDGECIDVNAAKDKIPPFPRVTREKYEDGSNIAKIEDAWVGDYTNGTKPFVEVDFINGFFNAIEKMQSLKRDTEATLAEQSKNVPTTSESVGGIIKHPLSSFDFYVSKNPYGNSSDISNDEELYDFCGKIALRMYSILALNNFKMEIGNTFLTDTNIRNMGSVEADNFYDCVKITNDNILSMIKNGVISASTIIEKIKSTGPWGDSPLFLEDNNNLTLNAYKIDGGSNIMLPIQGISFENLDNLHSAFNQGNIIENEDVSLKTIKKTSAYTKSAFVNAYVTDDYEFAKNIISNANTNVGSAYTDYYNTITSKVEFSDEEYSNFLKVDGNPSVCGTIELEETKKDYTFEIDGNFIKVGDATYSNDTIDSIANSATQGNISNFTITEVFGIDENHNINENRSFLNTASKLAWTITYDDMHLNGNDYKTAIAILSMKTNQSAFKDVFRDKNRTFIYLPKLCLLKLAILCFATRGTDNDFKDTSSIVGTMKNNLKINSIDSELAEIVRRFSKPVRYYLARYFNSWVTSSELAKKMYNELTNKSNYINSSVSTTRSLLDQRSKFVKEMTNELLKPMLFVKLSANSTLIKNEWYQISKGTASIFFESFMNRLKDLYDVTKDEDNSGSLTKTTDDPTHTSDDMKIELYRYMKQLYDKWIPMSSESDWALETFFPKEDETKADTGHTFHFIDSYYNKIGDKLLINPKKLSENIGALLENGDVNAMMLGFMVDVYAYNKCMFKCIQNFADLSKTENSMKEMFTPLSIDSIKWSSEINKHPNFVVVYPYQPSRNLNVDNAEYNDDGFMLNDELETPKAIRTKDDKEYRIPAFGVSYGKQYQSYFKSVNINMQSPIATEQSIRAKHFIIQQAATQKERGVTAQDLYDIYATQSYTCDVEMMGCAWVQPLMYFVLLNVPMFRGSYMIMKVRHSIRPGDMSTTFTGCRMANMSTKLVEDIFTDDDFLQNNEYYDEETTTDRELKADITNDCEYRIYPLWETSSSVLTGDENQKAKQLMDKLMAKGFNKTAAAGIVGNMSCEVGEELDHTKVNGYDRGFIAGGLCQWNDRYYNLTNLLNGVTKGYGQKENKSNTWLVKDVKNKLAELGVDHQITFINDTIGKVSFRDNSKTLFSKDALNNCKTARDAALSFEYNYERSNGANRTARGNKAEDFYKAYDSTVIENKSEPSNKDPNDKRDVNKALFEAINKSAQATPSIGVELKYTPKDNGYFRITQKDNGTSKLGVVFDMVLNSSYYDHIQELGYVYPNGGLENDCPPQVIFVKGAEKVDNTKKNVWITLYKENDVGSKVPKSLLEGNTSLLTSLAKRANKVNNEADFVKEVEQMKDWSVSGEHVLKFLEKYKPEDCDNLFNKNDSNEGINSKPSDVVPSNSNIEIDGWSVKKAVKWIIDNQLPQFGDGKCASYVEDAIAAGGGPLSERMYCTENGAPNDHATNLRYYGILEKHGFKQIYSSTINPGGNTQFQLQAGDVCIIGHKSHGKFHACMWTGDRWYSDHKQNNMISSKYPKRDAPYPYAIYRFHNKKGTQI